MTQILGIKLSDHGPVCYFSSGQFVVQKGQAVLVETDQGLALGRVATISAPEGAETASAAPTRVVEAAPAQAPEGAAPFAPFEETFSGADWEAEAEAPAPAAAPAEAPASRAAHPEPQGHIGGDGEHAVVMDCTQPQPRPKNLKGLMNILRLARDEDLEAEAENRRLARRAHAYCRGCINEQKLDMKLVDVEVLHDRGKMIFFFTAPGRIDFRELIKSLVREFHTRIELRQIGVRHETQMLGAIGNCGQVCCCRRFLRKFAPVTIKMAKEQNLFLNPAKISGICGRLLCCLSYEQKGYEEFHKQCPKIGKRVQTALGSLKVLRANFFKKSISVWMEEGGEREFTLEEWRELVNRQPGDRPAEGQPAAQNGQQGAPQARERGGDRGDRGDRGGRGERRSERGPRGERPERPEKAERPERPERGERPERSERGERGRGPRQPQQAPHQSGQPGQTGQAGPSAHQPGQPAPATPQDAPSGEAQRERSRPRRKRRKPRGPKPEN